MKNLKIALLALSIITATSLVGCGNKDETPAKPTTAAAPSVDVNTKKQNFFDKMRPGFEKENQRVAEERAEIVAIEKDFSDDGELSSSQLRTLSTYAEDYRLDVPTDDNIDSEWINELLMRVNVLPESLVLTQAANESAWGTSRFAKEANNFFGQWCFSEGCGVVPKQRAAGATHEVAKFDSAQQSIHGYFMNVNSFAAYQNLREIRAQLSQTGADLYGMQTAIELTNGLLSYSERGQDYVNDLQSMIRHNQDYWKTK